ncbi:MAG: hypothetical protein ACJ75F_12730, partial [Flavisolibacter sp.]
SDKPKETTDKGFSFTAFSGTFRKLSLPYQLSDTALIKNRDTAIIRVADFSSLVPDSIKNIVFGKGTKVKYTAIGYFPGAGHSNFYVVKGQSGQKRAALLMAFNSDVYSGMLPFLVPDADASTSQVSVVDRSLSIQKNVTQKTGGVITGEGKDVYDYDASENKFALILTNPLNSKVAITNPIDTFSRKHKLAGDYLKDKKNFVSVRDGRYPNQLQVYIHLEKNDGGCTGELKGDLLLTSSTTAIYRQGGDPCVLSFRFSPSAVVVKEDEGCGSHRGLDCLFDGSFARKKEAKPKQGTKKK